MERVIVGIDPGLNGSGVAVCRNKAVTHCTYATSAPSAGLVERARTQADAITSWLCGCLFDLSWDASIHVFVEQPHTYKRQAKDDVEELILHAGLLGGMIHARSGGVLSYLRPFVWKGTTPGDIFTQRILSKLQSDERGLIPKIGAKAHNVIDAVGIALWVEGRLGK